jgi:hypothetical protein
MKETGWTTYLGYFLLSCVAWYSAVIVAGVLSLLPVHTETPDNLFRMYWPAYYSEVSEKGFVVAFYGMCIGTGFFLRLFGRCVESPISIGRIAGIVALIPLAMVGVMGVSVAPDWPAKAPPVALPGGPLLAIPGLTFLMWATHLALKRGWLSRRSDIHSAQAELH